MVLGLSLFSIPAEADLVADYRFDGTLSSWVPGAPDLVDLGNAGQITSTAPMVACYYSSSSATTSHN
jgi:hypothetical protein